MKMLIVVLLILSIPLWAFGGLQPSGFSLIEPSSSGWFQPTFGGRAGFSLISGNGRTLVVGTGVGLLTFDLHPSLTAIVEFGYSRLHNFSGSDSGFILGGFDIDWHPSDSFTLQFHFTGSFPETTITEP